MRRIDTEDLHFLGVERELLEREHQIALFGMALDIGIRMRIHLLAQGLRLPRQFSGRDEDLIGRLAGLLGCRGG